MDRVKVVHFVLIGDGPTRSRLEQEARLRSLDAALIFAGDVPAEQLPLFAAACDVGLYLSQSVGSIAHPFDVREICDFLDAGRPVVVASDDPDARCFVQTHDAGVASTLTGNRIADVGNIVRNLGAILTDDRARLKRSENARKLGRSLQSTATGGMLDIVRASLRRAASL